MNATGIWGLDTGRPGEFMQVTALGNSLGQVFERIRLTPECAILTPLPAIPPRLIISFGRAAQTALRLASGYSPRPLLVHLGTPGKTPITAFDLIIPMPQDDYPPAENVQFINLPLNAATAAAILPPPPAGDASRHCTIIIGGPSRHFRLPRRTLRQIINFGARLAAANDETLLVVTSPRTADPVLAELKEQQRQHGFTLMGFGNEPFATTLQTGSRFLVTGDSASMLAEACRTGAPVWLFPLPPRPNLSNFLQHAADLCLGAEFRHRLVRRGIVGGGTNFRRWHCTLDQLGYISIATKHLRAKMLLTKRPQDAFLRWAPGGNRADTGLSDCRTRILGMLAGAWAMDGERAATGDDGDGQDFHRL